MLAFAFYEEKEVCYEETCAENGQKYPKDRQCECVDEGYDYPKHNGDYLIEPKYANVDCGAYSRLRGLKIPFLFIFFVCLGIPSQSCEFSPCHVLRNPEIEALQKYNQYEGDEILAGQQFQKQISELMPTFT